MSGSKTIPIKSQSPTPEAQTSEVNKVMCFWVVSVQSITPRYICSINIKSFPDKYISKRKCDKPTENVALYVFIINYVLKYCF